MAQTTTWSVSNMERNTSTEGVKHPWCWARWDDEYKGSKGLVWYEDEKP